MQLISSPQTVSSLINKSSDIYIPSKLETFTALMFIVDFFFSPKTIAQSKNLSTYICRTSKPTARLKEPPALERY